MENVMNKVTPPQPPKGKNFLNTQGMQVDVSNRKDILLIEKLKSGTPNEISTSDIKLLDEYVSACIVISKPKTLNEAMARFQALNISALKEKTNPYFKSTYSDINSVINAVNHGSQFGLSFTQSVNYRSHNYTNVSTKTDAKSGNTFKTEANDLIRDIYVETTICHDTDTNTKSCTVPVLIKGMDKDDPQKMGSAITYAKRYGLQALYGLASDDD